MIVTKKFVFIHLHKSGGTFLNNIFTNFFHSTKTIGYHYPITMIPSEYKHLPILGSIRNPWDFYVSYYAFQKSLIENFESKYGNLSKIEYQSLTERGIDPRNGIDIIFDVASHKGSLDFAKTLPNLLALGTSKEILNKVLDLMPVELGRRGKNTTIHQQGFRGMNVTHKELAKIRETGEGLYAFLFRRMYGDANNIYFLKMNNLRNDLLDFFKHIGVVVTQNMREFILTAQATNVSHHEHYSKYYTDDLKNSVQEKDACVIEKFGFEF